MQRGGYLWNHRNVVEQPRGACGQSRIHAPGRGRGGHGDVDKRRARALFQVRNQLGRNLARLGLCKSTQRGSYRGLVLGGNELGQRLEMLAYLNLFRCSLSQGIDAGAQRVDGALALALLIA